MSAIVAAVLLAGCGQRGPLYMPVVPPMPPQPHFQTQPPAAAPGNAEPASGVIVGAPGPGLTLTPDTALATPPTGAASAANAASAPAASSAQPD